MFFGLSIFFKTWLKLSLFCWYYQHCHISLTCTHDHIGNVVFVARGIKKSEPLLVKNEIDFCVFPSFSIFFLLRDDINQTSIFPSLHLILFGFFFVQSYFLLINLLQLFHNVSSQCWLSRIHMTYKHYVSVLFGQYSSIDVFFLIPFGAEQLLEVDFGIAWSNNNWFFFGRGYSLFLFFLGFRRLFFLLLFLLISFLLIFKKPSLFIIQFLASNILLAGILNPSFIVLPVAKLERIYLRNISIEGGNVVVIVVDIMVTPLFVRIFVQKLIDTCFILEVGNEVGVEVPLFVGGYLIYH